MDLNDDGLINKADLLFATKLFGSFSSSFRNQYARDSPTMLFMAMDKRGVDLVDFEDFSRHVTESPGRAVWVCKMHAIIDEELRK
jgi:hypothetical protein